MAGGEKPSPSGLNPVSLLYIVYQGISTKYNRSDNPGVV